MPDREGNSCYVWHCPGCPVRVRLCLAALTGLEAELATPGEGLLIGRTESQTTEISKLLPARGRSIAELVRECGEDQVAGYYRVSAGEPLQLNALDLALARVLFSRPQQVILRTQLLRSGPANATFFFHRNGCMEGEYPLLEFPLDASLLSSTAWSGGEACTDETLSPAAASGEELKPPGLTKTPADSLRRICRVAAWSIASLALLAIVIVMGAFLLRIPQFSWLPSTYTQPLLAIFSIFALAGFGFRKRSLERVALAGFLLVSWPPAEWVLSRPLEAPYGVQPFHCPPAVQAIVVLSSAAAAPEPARPFPLPDEATFSRCEFAAWIQKNRPDLPVLASGGSGGGAQPPLAETMRGLLRRAGVPDTMIWTESRSHNTHENAVYCAGILRSHGIREIALVIETRSMYRAAACFRKEGIIVVPAPSASRGWDTLGQELLPGWRTIARNEVTLHEMAGIIWYRLNGWI